MHQDEFFKIVGILIVSFFIIYMAVKMFHLQTKVIEGLTSGSDALSSSDTNTNITSASGEAGTSASYAAAVKAEVVKLQDELLVSKYRKDYEAAIINLDDYFGFSMLKLCLNLKMSEDNKSNFEIINKLNILKNAKESLNATMVFLDKQ
jgi:hypothetical protein